MNKKEPNEKLIEPFLQELTDKKVAMIDTTIKKEKCSWHIRITKLY